MINYVTFDLCIIVTFEYLICVLDLENIDETFDLYIIVTFEYLVCVLDLENIDERIYLF